MTSLDRREKQLNQHCVSKFERQARFEVVGFPFPPRTQSMLVALYRQRKSNSDSLVLLGLLLDIANLLC